MRGRFYEIYFGGGESATFFSGQYGTFVLITNLFITLLWPYKIKMILQWIIHLNVDH
jgi:hypothetical protein